MDRLGSSLMVVASSLALAALAASCTAAATTSRCPAEFPVEREGFCYAAEADAELAMDAGSTVDTGSERDSGSNDDGAMPDAAATDDSGAGATDSGGSTPDSSSVICVREHPIVEGTRRYCNAGDCFCSDPDSCVPEDIAAACCDVPVVCGGDAGPSVICVGEHPQITGMGTLRWCLPGNCFCASPDNCYPTETAAACCSVPVVCY